MIFVQFLCHYGKKSLSKRIKRHITVVYYMLTLTLERKRRCTNNHLSVMEKLFFLQSQLNSLLFKYILSSGILNKGPTTYHRGLGISRLLLNHVIESAGIRTKTKEYTYKQPHQNKPTKLHVESQATKPRSIVLFLQSPKCLSSTVAPSLLLQDKLKMTQVTQLFEF